ncbi:MAG: hypothetical protein LQ351_005936 [Letrouitia transgressa]|nr:MAG: hypothetical protein LQ351_005936 [Letrouitia transgressa]
MSSPTKGSAISSLDDVMPLFFAAHPTVVPKYKVMAALDPKERTESSFEHRFRKWRQEGRTLVEANGGPEAVLALSGTTGKTNKEKEISGIATKKRKAVQAENSTATAAEDTEPQPKRQALKKKSAATDTGTLEADTTTRATPSKSNVLVKIEGKASALDCDGAVDPVLSSPVKANEKPEKGAQKATGTKKAPVVKKGIAKIVKKSNQRKRDESSEEPQEATGEGLVEMDFVVEG